MSARALARRAPHQEGVTVLGPSTAPLALLRGRHRRRFLLKAARDIAVQPLLQTWLAADRPARFSAPADRRRSLFLPVSMSARKKRGNTGLWQPCACENRMVATRAFPGWGEAARPFSWEKSGRIQRLAGRTNGHGRGFRPCLPLLPPRPALPDAMPAPCSSWRTRPSRSTRSRRI